MRSQRTRTRVVAAAHDLFLQDGYDATAVEAVAGRAGVATQTVYNLFHTKCDLLAAVLDVVIAGDTEPLPVIDRPWFDRLPTDAGPAAVTRLAITGAAIVARTAPVYEVLRRASSRPELAALLAQNRGRRRADQAHLVRRLAEDGHLRTGLEVDVAADIVYGLVNEELFLLLTADCDWTFERFEAWLGQTLVAQLCGE